jgi:hypothetical protein
MQDAMRRVPCSLDPIGQRSPRMRHTKQRSLALGVLKRGSDLEAIGGAPPVERYEFAGGHPHPQYVFLHKSRRMPVCSASQRKNSLGGFIVPGRCGQKRTFAGTARGLSPTCLVAATFPGDCRVGFGGHVESATGVAELWCNR